MIEAFPLCWPIDYPRSKYPTSSRFKTSFGKARDLIIKEARLLGAKNLIISSNVPLRQDGLPYSNFKSISDVGIAVYFNYEGQQVVMCCDKWNKAEDNIVAVSKALEAMRGMTRWGVSDMLKRAFTGFKALPEQASIKEWYEILEVDRLANAIQIRDAYRKKVMQTHPDKGGSTEAFNAVQKAYEKGISLNN